MNSYKIVIVNFFTEKKKFAKLNAKTHEDLESQVEILGRKLPECVIAAYLDGELQLATRPRKMMEEKELVQNQEMEPFEFILRWKVGFFGQRLPDFSLPQKFIQASRAIFQEIVPSAAGV